MMTALPLHGQRTELIRLLQREIECAGNLLESLEREYLALAQHQTTALEEVIADKQGKIRQLESIGQQRETLLASINMTADIWQNKAGSGFDGDTQLSAFWQQLMSLATKCQAKNRINGSIVEVGYQQSRYALDILQGIPFSPELYDDSGQTTKSNKTHSLARA